MSALSELVAVVLAGLAIGVAGSLHCVAMCGPLVASLRRGVFVRPDGSPNGARAASLMAGVAFPAGRIATYAAMGAFAGTLGRIVVSGGLGRGLALAAGAAMIGMALVSTAHVTAPFTRSLGRFVGGALGTVRRRYTRQPLLTALIAGALNGLLPCGMVYAALMSALATGRPAAAATLMTAFGIGTTPALASIWWSASLPAANRRGVRFVSPIVMVVAGVLLISRGVMTSAGSTTGHMHSVMGHQQP